MRKMKKINGYLVVRFNDREKRVNEGTGLGSFGVIDAEQYTGILDIDRDVMEYDSADTLEEAIEQARGLEAEPDIEEPQIKVTIITETDTGSTEEEIDPVELFELHKASLEHVNALCKVPGLGDILTTQQMYGYASALYDLGIIDLGDERFQIDPAILPDQISPLLTCAQNKNLRKHTETQTSDNPPERSNFLYPPSDNRIYPQIYALGMQLLKDCPDNDCRIFRNTFQMCLEVDSQLDRLTSFPRRWLSKRIEREYRYLEQMFCYNSAVKAYREQHPTATTHNGGKGYFTDKKSEFPIVQETPECKYINEIDRADLALQRVAQLIQRTTETNEQMDLLCDMSVLGRLIESARYTPATSDKEKLEHIVAGLIAKSIHLVTKQKQPNLMEVEFIDTVHRKSIARFIFEQQSTGYCIKTVEFL